MRLGVLDIGSNSAHLKVVDACQGAPPLPICAVKEPTHLGEAVEPDGSISADGIERVARAAAACVRSASRFGVTDLYMFVTSAVRDAANRDTALSRIEDESGIRPQFLSGEDEARLTYLAVHHWYGWSSGRLLVLDIGGGSMEVALGRDIQPDLAISLPLGAGRLTRDFLPGDPPDPSDVRALRRHVRATVRQVGDRLRWDGPPDLAVATSKTFKQLARLSGAPPRRRGLLVDRALTVRDLDRWVPRLARLSAEERAGLRGVSRGRAGQILAGAVVAKKTMKALELRSVRLCPWALREGIVLHHVGTRIDEGFALPLRPVSLPDRELMCEVIDA